MQRLDSISEIAAQPSRAVFAIRQVAGLLDARGSWSRRPPPSWPHGAPRSLDTLRDEARNSPARMTYAAHREAVTAIEAANAGRLLVLLHGWDLLREAGEQTPEEDREPLRALARELQAFLADVWGVTVVDVPADEWERQRWVARHLLEARALPPSWRDLERGRQ